MKKPLPSNREEMLEHYEKFRKTHTDTKKKRVPKILLALNGLLLLLMFFLYNYQKSEISQNYQTLFTHDTIQYSLTLTQNKKEKKIVAALLATNQDNAPRVVLFKERVISLELFRGSTRLTDFSIGRDVMKVSLNAGEAQVFVSSISMEPLLDVFRIDRQNEKPKKRSLFSSGGGVPLQARYRLETTTPYSGKLDFTVEID